MKRKTYGIFGYVEYEIGHELAGRKFKTFFKNGSITGRGIVPAEYSTGHPMVQYAIENHPLYKTGVIKLVKEEEVAEPEGRLGGKAPKTQPGGKAPGTVNPAPDAPGTGTTSTEPAGKAAGTAPSTEGTADTPAGKAAGTAEGAPGGKAPGTVEAGGKAAGTVVEVACLQDAAEYLKEQYGVATWNIKSRKKAESVGAEYGVEFVWK